MSVYADCECGMARISSDVERCSTCEVAVRQAERIASLQARLEQITKARDEAEKQFDSDRKSFVNRVDAKNQRIAELETKHDEWKNRAIVAEEALGIARAEIALLKCRCHGSGTITQYADHIDPDSGYGYTTSEKVPCPYCAKRTQEKEKTDGP